MTAAAPIWWHTARDEVTACLAEIAAVSAELVGRLGQQGDEALDDALDDARTRLGELDDSLEWVIARLRGPVRAAPPTMASPSAAERRPGRKLRDPERREAEGAATGPGLREIRERFESAFANAPIGIALVDMQGRWLQTNAALCQILGVSREDLLATTLGEVIHPDDQDLDLEDRERLLTGDLPSYTVDKRCLHPAGAEVWIQLTFSLVRGEDGTPLYTIMQVQDVSERQALHARLDYIVDHDFLTGLYNRRRFEQELCDAVARASRYGHGGAVLLLDLDHFKTVNDTFGHRAGDDLLKGLADALRHRCAPRTCWPA